MTRERDPRRRRLLGRRPPGVHRAQRPAPVSPDEVLERAPTPGDPCRYCSSSSTQDAGHVYGERKCCPDCDHRPVVDVSRETPADVSRETWAELEASLEAPAARALEELGRYVAGGQVPPLTPAGQLYRDDVSADPPPLRKSQVAHLEALTALWSREVRLEVPEDATMVYGASRSLPPVPPAGRVEAGIRRAVDAGLEAAAVAPPALQTPAPSFVPPAAGPARVSSWTSRHDPRSLEFALRDRLRHPAPLQDLLLDHGPILDQGTTPPLSLRDAAACTGMAAVAAANVLAVRRNQEDLAGGRPLQARLRREEEALEVYHRAQDLDHVHGHDAPGTSVLAVMQAGQEAGWWDTYLWALGGTRDIAQALLQFRAPVVLGIPWPAGLEDPDEVGVIRPTGTPGMGHALAVVGLRRSHAARPGPFFVLQQSRGPAEGDGGLVYLHHTHLAQLLRGVGEAAVPLPRGFQ